MNNISEKEYRNYKKEIVELISNDPSVGTSEAERLKLISFAVEAFEKQKFFFNKPSPIEAILFRMEEMGLSKVDLAPYLGGKNRVSEVLSRKRPLTIPMVKALHKYLDIPLEVLLQEEGQTEIKFSSENLEFNDSLIKEIYKKGWLPKLPEISDYRKSIHAMLKPIGGLTPANALFRKSAQANIRGINESAAFIWTAKVLVEAKTLEANEFHQEKITFECLKRIAKLSYFEQGPLLARKELLKYGIRLVIVPHLSSTFIDGGTIPDDQGVPVIGLSLRYDRLDSFWHTLMHELAHIHKHFKLLTGPFLDDSDNDDTSDPIEKEADQLAKEAFIPKNLWRTSDVVHLRTAESIEAMANDLHISPSIIAGYIRYETKKFNMFSEMLGSNSVKKLFGIKP